MDGRLARMVIAAVFALLMCSTHAAAQPGESGRSDRPAALVPLYVAFAGLQVLDGHSTLNAVGVGARETNPLMRQALGNTAGMIALKSGTAVGVVMLTEKLWPRNRAAAVLTMIAINSAYATIAAHNYRTAQRR
jgi:predicted anti-sigma-YlaC factor YlaD